MMLLPLATVTFQVDPADATSLDLGVQVLVACSEWAYPLVGLEHSFHFFPHPSLSHLSFWALARIAGAFQAHDVSAGYRHRSFQG